MSDGLAGVVRAVAQRSIRLAGCSVLSVPLHVEGGAYRCNKGPLHSFAGLREIRV
ncbi:hypothetical protein J3T99_00765 [Acetobacteraceae bacterium B3987]|nr:hypothetical protein [Acetobacteraceae bacterium B3987]